MRATLVKTNDQFLLKLIPDNNADEEKLVEEFGQTLNRAHLINHRGFTYMSAEVEFLVQPYRGID